MSGLEVFLAFVVAPLVCLCAVLVVVDERRRRRRDAALRELYREAADEAERRRLPGRCW